MLELPDPSEEDPPTEDAPAEEDADREEDPAAEDATMDALEDAADVPALEDEPPALLDALAVPPSPGASTAEQRPLTQNGRLSGHWVASWPCSQRGRSGHPADRNTLATHTSLLILMGTP